jgi:hypothetical protein
MLRLSTMLVLALAAAVPAPAFAGDIQGDAYDCQELWVMRNKIYKDGGYCFTSNRAITYFGNGGCTHHALSEVPLSDTSRLILRDIRKSERRQGC